jgi:diguanylate cyclase
MSQTLPPTPLDSLLAQARDARSSGALDLALRRAHEACDAARGLGPAEQAMALNTLADALECIGDPWQAERLLGDALPLARACAQPRPLLVTLDNLGSAALGAFYLLRDGGAGSDAQAALQRSRAAAQDALALAPQVGDAALAMSAEAKLGESLVHLGEFDAAGEQLARALQAATALGAAAQTWRIRCTIGELLLARGQAAQARARLAALLDELHGAEAHSIRFRVHHALHRACRALGEHTLALEHLEAYLQLERQRSARQLRARAQLFVTRVETEQAQRQAQHARHEVQLERRRVAELELHALQDPLTGLANRRRLDRELPRLLITAVQRRSALTVAMIDIDLFKSVNDRFGHALGDRVLATLAQMLGENIRDSDLVARVGGEEFLLVLPDTPPHDALDVCERLRVRVATHDWGALADGLAVTLSIGLAHTPPYERHSLFDRADAALYRAKREGRNRVESA